MGRVVSFGMVVWREMLAALRGLVEFSLSRSTAHLEKDHDGGTGCIIASNRAEGICHILIPDRHVVW
jgi:hypothetical protein